MMQKLTDAWQCMNEDTQTMLAIMAMLIAMFVIGWLITLLLDFLKNNFDWSKFSIAHWLARSPEAKAKAKAKSDARWKRFDARCDRFEARWTERWNKYLALRILGKSIFWAMVCGLCISGLTIIFFIVKALVLASVCLYNA